MNLKPTKHKKTTFAVMLMTVGLCFSGCSKEAVDTRPVGEKLDGIFESLAADGQFQGGAVLARDGQVIWQGAYGLADIEAQRPLDNNSVYELASIGKSFTAMAVLTLVRDDKLSLSDKASDYIPDLPYPDITIESLLTHTSGLPDYTSALTPDEIPSSFTGFATNTDILNWIIGGTDAQTSIAGEAFQYSNTNYIFLALIVERVSEQSFKSYLQEAVFDPLGMTTMQSFGTRFTTGDIPDDYAFGYVDRPDEGLVLPETLPQNAFLPALSTLEGDGTVIGSLGDFAKWEAAWTTDTLVGEDLRTLALSPFELRSGERSEYGYGWRTDGPAETVYHWGGWPGYNTGVYLDPKSRTLFVFAITAPNSNYSWMQDVQEAVFEP